MLLDSSGGKNATVDMTNAGIRRPFVDALHEDVDAGLLIHQVKRPFADHLWCRWGLRWADFSMDVEVELIV